MPMSSTGSSRGTPSGKRFCTSCGRNVCREGKGNYLDHRFSRTSSLVQDGCFSYLYGLEHELSVVEGPQVFGDIKAN